MAATRMRTAVVVDGSTAFTLVTDESPAGLPAERSLGRGPGRRGHLRLVPSHPGLDAGTAAPVRLTRPGRLVRAAAVVVFLLAAIGLATGAVRAAALGGDHRVTVHTGQTMWEVAARELPDLPTPEGVARIQLANGLSSAEVHAGQVLSIP